MNPTNQHFSSIFDEDNQLELAERQALRRVPGLSTELTDISEVEYRQLKLERVILASVWTSGTIEDAEKAMAELARLAEAAGSEVLAAFMQRRSHPDSATYIGSGKVEELHDEVICSGADTVICDGELSPAQLRTLEDRLGIKVIDRTTLILDLFAQHAKSAAGQLQVELAQLNYMKQRLRGWGGNLSRQVGGRAASGVGIGGRGPGETRLETDRRRINSRITQLKAKLRQLDQTRQVERADRKRNRLASVALVGYTNAGKSSILNRLANSNVLVEDSLFATLDPTTRRLETGDGRAYTLTDTVGFVRHLPHDLVEAFRSTLEETTDADLLVHVVDGQDTDPLSQIDAVHQVLGDIGANQIPELLVVNKMDLLSAETLWHIRAKYPAVLTCSARTGEGLAELRTNIEQNLPLPEKTISVLIPWQDSQLVDRIHKEGVLVSAEHLPEGTYIKAHVHQDLYGELADFAK